MENITIEATNHTPSVDFNPDGFLKIEGRSYPENASEFFDPLIEFASRLEAEEVLLEINLEYINTASSKKIYNLLKELDMNEEVDTITVDWHYEEGDDDSIETAEIFEESLGRTNFRYNEMADLTL
jgi:hypothetical protein